MDEWMRRRLRMRIWKQCVSAFSDDKGISDGYLSYLELLLESLAHFSNLF